MLEEGGDAGDLQAQAPGGASGGGERLVLPAGGGGPRAGGTAADGRHPEEQGEGRAGRPPHHRSAGGEGRRAAGCCGLSCCSPGGCRAALGTDSSAPQKLNKKVQSFNSPHPLLSLPSARSPPPLGGGRAEADSGRAIGCAERQRRAAAPGRAGGVAAGRSAAGSGVPVARRHLWAAGGQDSRAAPSHTRTHTRRGRGSDP